jgi:hypothetical protein
LEYALRLGAAGLGIVRRFLPRPGDGPGLASDSGQRAERTRPGRRCRRRALRSGARARLTGARWDPAAWPRSAGGARDRRSRDTSAGVGSSGAGGPSAAAAETAHCSIRSADRPCPDGRADVSRFVVHAVALRRKAVQFCHAPVAPATSRRLGQKRCVGVPTAFVVHASMVGGLSGVSLHTPRRIVTRLARYSPDSYSILQIRGETREPGKQGSRRAA